MLTKRVYEVDPLACPKCGGVMKIISFIERRPRDVIQRILRGHQSGAMVGGLWEGPLRTRASARSPPPGPRHPTAAADELELVIDGDFLESQRRADQPAELDELQWVRSRVPLTGLAIGYSCRWPPGCDRGAHRPPT